MDLLPKAIELIKVAFIIRVRLVLVIHYSIQCFIIVDSKLEDDTNVEEVIALIFKHFTD